MASPYEYYMVLWRVNTWRISRLDNALHNLYCIFGTLFFLWVIDDMTTGCKVEFII